MEVYRFGQCLDWRFSPISTFLSVVSFRAFRDAPHSRFRCGDPNQCLPNFLKITLTPPLNLHSCISLVEVYCFGQCLGKRFSPISTFFSLASSRALRDAPLSRFWCRDLWLCLLDFLKMLDLALSQIYTRVFHLWKYVALDNAWVKDSRPFISFFHSRAFTNQFRVSGTRKYRPGFWKSTQSWSK